MGQFECHTLLPTAQRDTANIDKTEIYAVDIKRRLKTGEPTRPIAGTSAFPRLTYSQADGETFGMSPALFPSSQNSQSGTFSTAPSAESKDSTLQESVDPSFQQPVGNISPPVAIPVNRTDQKSIENSISRSSRVLVQSRPTLVPHTIDQSRTTAAKVHSNRVALLNPWERIDNGFASHISTGTPKSGITYTTKRANNMGIADATSFPSSWNQYTDISSEKMEASTQITESERTHDDDDTTIRSLDSTLEIGGAGTPLFGYTIPIHGPPATNQALLGTPSTTSTAPSTADDTSLNLDPYLLERLSLRLDPHSGPPAEHRRGSSWGEGFQQQQQQDQSMLYPPHHDAWGTGGGYTQQRVASFRGEQQGYPPLAPVNVNRWPSQQQFIATNRGMAAAQGDMRGFQGQPSVQHCQIHDRRTAPFQQASSNGLPTTPPRSSRVAQRLPQAHRFSSQQHSVPSTNPPTVGGTRASSEVLKTLLRKKACLYEPDTSRAVTLITWLVGRHLALEFGYFSRQQLQAGVHSCVAGKIDSRVITRTKVNRCMQIILNSCFHYIIPRPDGTEENGEAFRRAFAAEVSEDEALLSQLSDPWHDMVVAKDAVLRAASSLENSNKPSPTTTPQSSPKVSSINAVEKHSPGGKESLSGDDSKRAVLLCFNENVRSAQDVFRCHNEFIHDTAHGSNLQLSSLEWSHFFGKDASADSSFWCSIGIPQQYVEGKDRSSIDALGVMSNIEASSFRASWCAKRYDHNHELCGFAHSEVNGGWLRRDPSLFTYDDEMCPHVTKISPGRIGTSALVLNECPNGVHCKKAHSVEEILYHPKRYKTIICQSVTRTGSCACGVICPNFHPFDSYKFLKKPDSRSPRHTRHMHQQANASKTVPVSPIGSPVLYASPAPVSSFEQQLCTPGLRQLFRRHCAVSLALLRGDGHCVYHCFGDDVVPTREVKEDTNLKVSVGA